MTGVLQGLAATTRDVNLSPPTSEDSYIYIYIDELSKDTEKGHT
jgi:hypothetical protein